MDASVADCLNLRFEAVVFCLRVLTVTHCRKGHHPVKARRMTQRICFVDERFSFFITDWGSVLSYEIDWLQDGEITVDNIWPSNISY